MEGKISTIFWKADKVLSSDDYLFGIKAWIPFNAEYQIPVPWQ
jgi:hypothetical protein